MSFESHIITKNEVAIHLLLYDSFPTESFLDQLTDIEKERFFSFKCDKRKKEFMATRILRHRIFGFEHIHYTETGAPYIKGEGFISISHATGIVGLAICDEFPIGMDIEMIRTKAVEVHEKFLSSQEKKIFDCSSDYEMTKIWSAKETLYKLSQRKGIIFKDELIIHHEEDDTLNCTIVQPDGKLNVDLSSHMFRNFVITFNHVPCTAAIH